MRTLFQSFQKLVVLILLALSFQACAQSNVQLKYVQAKDTSFQCVGRYAKQKDGSLSYSLPSTSVYCAFEGSTLSLVIKSAGNNYMAVVIDGEEPLVIKLNAKDTIYLVSNSLNDRKHQLQIVKRTESFVGNVQFKGILIQPKGKVYKYENMPSKKLLVIGNSITCGYGNDTSITSNPSTGFSSKNEDAYNSYGHITSRRLQAQYQAFAYSGRGLTKNFDGTDKGIIPSVFDRVIPDEDSPLWNHSLYVPDWIVVNLGTNDFSSEARGGGKIDSVVFVNKYLEFVSKLKKEYPNAQIILAVGSMMSDYYPEGAKHWTRIQAYVNAVVDYEKQKGNLKINFLAFEPQSAPYGEDWHPSKSTHQAMATKLTDFIKKLD